LLAEPRGFCAGVDRAIEIVERALAKFGAPIYVRHEIVHNTYVVNDLKAKGAIFIEELSDVPPGATLIFSAHGVSKAVQEEAKRAVSTFLTPPARWSARCMWKWPSSPKRATSSS
jgi:4-hydroxy-3-methylbut-2-enyl diphosphate reductase